MNTTYSLRSEDGFVTYFRPINDKLVEVVSAYGGKVEDPDTQIEVQYIEDARALWRKMIAAGDTRG